MTISTTQHWLQQVEKDLKGRPIEDLHWSLSEHIRVNPFVTSDDLAPPPAPLAQQPNAWQITEQFDISAPDANAQILEALNGGVEGLVLHCTQVPDSATLGSALEGVFLDFVSLHLVGPGVKSNPGAALAALLGMAKQKGIEGHQLRGSLGYDPAAVEGLQDWRYLAELIQFAGEQAPHFNVITIAEGDSMEAPEVRLAHLVRRGHLYALKLSTHSVTPNALARQIGFEVAIGPAYLVEIARIRALKLLWINALHAHGATPVWPAVAARFAEAAYTDDLYTNMIRATTMAMSAVLGGADRLLVRPYDDGRTAQATYGPAFGRRIARNVQHLLKMESGLDQYADPAAGSAYIETLTAQLAEAARKTL
jgi:methylmalonyl-CoA mutase